MKPIYCLATILIVLSSGCAKITYDTLLSLPEYPENTRQYNTDCALELLVSPYKAADAELKTKFAEYGYKNVQTGTHYKAAPEKVRIVSVLDWKCTYFYAEDGTYLETRVIVMVRPPGTLAGGKLVYSQARYFQAFSRFRLHDLSQESSAETELNGLKEAVANLFRTDEFRSALEP